MPNVYTVGLTIISSLNHTFRFMATEPLLTEFKAEIMKYEEVNHRVEILPKSLYIGPIKLVTDNIKSALSVETKAWKVGHCFTLA